MSPIHGLTTQLEGVFSKYPGLRLVPTADGVVLNGNLDFAATFNGHGTIEDSYYLKIHVPTSFPKQLPKVWDCGERVPESFHTHYDRSLCLGSPVRQHVKLGKHPTFLDFIDQLVVPYLYAFSYFEKHKELPFGELTHGNDGLKEDYAQLFGLDSKDGVVEMLTLASLKKRVANKRPCPCRSGKRLGRCHNRKVNHLRKALGRTWFAEELRSIQRGRWGLV